MGRNSLTLCVLLCLLPVAVLGQRGPPPLVALWQFPRDYTPVPDAFLLIETQNITILKQSRVTPSAPEACPEDAATDQNTFCAVVTPCPATGIVAYWVYAQWGERLSNPSNVMICLFTRDKPCVCQDPLDATPPAPLRPLTQVLTPPPPPSPQAPQSTQSQSPSTEVLVNAPPTQLATAPPASLTSTQPAVVAQALPAQSLFQIPAAPAGAGT